jgi:hypothetical protein
MKGRTRVLALACTAAIGVVGTTESAFARTISCPGVPEVSNPNGPDPFAADRVRATNVSCKYTKAFLAAYARTGGFYNFRTRRFEKYQGWTCVRRNAAGGNQNLTCTRTVRRVKQRITFRQTGGFG